SSLTILPAAWLMYTTDGQCAWQWMTHSLGWILAHPLKTPLNYCPHPGQNQPFSGGRLLGRWGTAGIRCLTQANQSRITSGLRAAYLICSFGLVVPSLGSLQARKTSVSSLAAWAPQFKLETAARPHFTYSA